MTQPAGALLEAEREKVLVEPMSCETMMDVVALDPRRVLMEPGVGVTTTVPYPTV